MDVEEKRIDDIEEKRIDEDVELLCPCCGRHRFMEKGAYEICPVCGWEDDPLQRREPDFAGGANKLSLNEAIMKYNEEAE